MSNRKRQRTLRYRNNILKYIATAFVICVVTTYLIYRNVKSPQTGGIPNVFWEEMTSNMTRGVYHANSKERVFSRLKSFKFGRASKNTLYIQQQKNISRIGSCLSESYGHTSLNASEFRCTHIMNLTGSLGRTGNQMFQVAALLGTAYTHGYTPVIRPGFPLTRWFHLPNVIDLQMDNSQKFYLKKCGTYTGDIDYLEHITNWTLYGYFQSWKFFSGAEHVVRKAFTLKDKYVAVAREYLSNVTKSGHRNVCVHVRRGDLNTKDLLQKGYTLADLGYIYRAMDFFRKQTNNSVQFIVLSDGMFWCLDHIHGADVIFSPFYETAEDMALMTLCDNVIVTSGTFGWWGAWLSRGQTVYYKGYPGKNTWLGTQLNVRDYYPPHWIGLW